MNKSKVVAATILLLIAVSLLVSASASVASGSGVNPMDNDPSDWAKKAIQFVVEKYGIPEDDLAISYEQGIRFSALEKTVQMVGVAAYPKKDVQFFDVVIDEDTGEISEDIRPLHRAEEQARLEKYGKLDPYLHELLTKAENNDHFLVSIWAAEFDKKRSKQELYEIVAKQWSEATEAMAKGLKPMQVEDRTLSRQIRQAYMALVVEDAENRVAPILQTLEHFGVEAQHSAAEPWVDAELSKGQILQLEKHPSVDRIFHFDPEVVPEIDGAVSTDRVPGVWARGITGNDVRIAILESNRIAYENVPCLYVGAVEDTFAPTSNHKTQVATIAACNPDFDPSLGDEFRGVAYNSMIIDGNPWSLNWAIYGAGADVVNASFGTNATYNLQNEDYQYDYWVRTSDTTIVKSAGNECNNNSWTCNITSPGKGWNVLTVGGLWDHGNALWSDDEMYDKSSWLNPENAVEKPEVVAPAEDIMSLDRNGQPITNHFSTSGTSFAAPQVSGLAALMMEEDYTLRSDPAAVKAILMASAVHDVTGGDHQDGAGAIDAELALKVASQHVFGTCPGSCWMSRPIYPWGGGTHYESFLAYRGDRVRVAISWYSQNNSEVYTFLGADLNLEIKDPNGNSVASSNSGYFTNNHEWVEFVAPSTGTYTIEIGYEAAYYTEVGIAVASQSTHLINVRSDYEGWESLLYGVTTDSQPASIRYSIYNESGNVVTDHDCYLNPMGRCYYDPWPGYLNGYALVDGQESVAAISESSHWGATLATSLGGVTEHSFSPRAWYLPAAYKHPNIRSIFYILNTSHAAETVRMKFFDDANGYLGSSTATLAAHEQRSFDLYNDCLSFASSSICNNFVGGSILIEDSSGQSQNADIIASSVIEWPNPHGTNQIGRTSQYTAVPDGRTALYGPSIFRIQDPPGTFTHISAVRLQNTSEYSWAHAYLYYIPRPDSNPQCINNYLTLEAWIQPNGSAGFNTRKPEFAPLDSGGCTEWRGTVHITSDQPLAGLINTVWPAEDKAGTHALFGPEDARSVVVFPKQMYGSGQWSRINVMNILDEVVEVTVRFYDTGGSLSYTHPSFTLQPYEAVVLNTKDVSGFPYGFSGSAVAYIQGNSQQSPVRPALVGTGDIMYSGSHPDGARAAIYEGIGQ